MSVGKPNNFEKFDDMERDINLNANLTQEPDSARLYRKKGSRVKKALNFSTKANKSKLA